MMMAGMGRKRGLFGSAGGFNASMPQDMAMPETAQMGGGGFVPEDRPGLGTRLLGKGWEEKAMALGGALMGNQWAIPQYLQQQGAMQRQAEQQAAAMRAQAQRLAAAQRMGISADQAMLLGDNIGSVVAGQMKGPEMDAFDRTMERAGIAKGSPEYNEYAKQHARRSAMGPDPILQNARLPNGAEFTGPLTAYEQMLRGGPGMAAPVAQSDWDSATPMGGAASNGSGNFRR
jgi:hypothetical protein